MLKLSGRILRAIGALAMVAGLMTGYAQAQDSMQDWPNKPVRILVPYAAGGNSDSMARISAQRLSETFGQQFVVENRLGANGAIATEAVARSASDGYTLLWGVQPPIAIFPAMTKVPYDSQKDFAPIAVVGTNPFVLVVNKDVPAKNVTEFIAWVKASPTTMSYAEGSLGSVTHLAMALFLKRAGLNMTNVSYRGNAPALTDIVAGHLPTMFSNLSDALPHIQSGAVRALAVSSEARVAQLPNVPTVAELGYPGYKAVTWNGLMAPAGTPKAIVDKINSDVVKALTTPEAREALLSQGAEAAPMTPDEYGVFLKKEIDKWGKVIKEAGIRSE